MARVRLTSHVLTEIMLNAARRPLLRHEQNKALLLLRKWNRASVINVRFKASDDKFRILHKEHPSNDDSDICCMLPTILLTAFFIAVLYADAYVSVLGRIIWVEIEPRSWFVWLLIPVYYIFLPVSAMLLNACIFVLIIGFPILLSLLLQDRIAALRGKPKVPWSVDLAPALSALQISLVAFILYFELGPALNYDCVNTGKSPLYDLLG
jgi:hypothetical protein